MSSTKNLANEGWERTQRRNSREKGEGITSIISIIHNSNRNNGNIMKFDGIATANSIRWIIIFKLIDRLLLIGLRI